MTKEMKIMMEIQGLVMNYYNYTTKTHFSNEQDELSFTLDYLKEINLIINEKLINEINRRIEGRIFDPAYDSVLREIRQLIVKLY